jgi:bacterioferritin-associated ferredoxin
LKSVFAGPTEAVVTYVTILWNRAAMIVCSCNVLSDQDVRSTLSGDAAARTCGEVYGCLGCSAQCGRCARTIRKIMNEALTAADSGCCGANGNT